MNFNLQGYCHAAIVKLVSFYRDGALFVSSMHPFAHLLVQLAFHTSVAQQGFSVHYFLYALFAVQEHKSLSSREYLQGREGYNTKTGSCQKTITAKLCAIYYL
jgi:hypothetical protein